jgi:hypothetical protein
MPSQTRLAALAAIVAGTFAVGIPTSQASEFFSDVGTTIAPVAGLELNQPTSFVAEFRSYGTSVSDGTKGAIIAPAGLDLTGAVLIGGSGTCEAPYGNQIKCSFGAVGAPRAVRIDAIPRKLGPAALTTTIGSASPDQDPSNNKAVRPFVVQAPDLSVAQSDAIDPARPGQAIPHTVTVGNTGDFTARASHVTVDFAPVGADPEQRVTLVPGSVAGAACTADTKITCALGDIAPGASRTITFDLTASKRGLIHSLASASTAGTDLDPADDHADETTLIAEDATGVVADSGGVLPVCRSLTAPSVAPTSSRVPLDAGARVQVNGPPGAFVRIGGKRPGFFRAQVDGRGRHGVAESVEFRIDGGKLRRGVFEPKSESPAWHVEVGTKGLARGAHTLTAITHLRGGRKKTVKLRFTADTCPPAFLRVFVRNRKTSVKQTPTDLRLRLGGGDVALGGGTFTLPGRVRVHANRSGGKAGNVRLVVNGRARTYKLTAKRSGEGVALQTQAGGPRIVLGSTLKVDRLPRGTTELNLLIAGQPSGLLTIGRGCAVSKASVRATDAAGKAVTLTAVNRNRC